MTGPGDSGTAAPVRGAGLGWVGLCFAGRAPAGGHPRHPVPCAAQPSSRGTAGAVAAAPGPACLGSRGHGRRSPRSRPPPRRSFRSGRCRPDSPGVSVVPGAVGAGRRLRWWRCCPGPGELPEGRVAPTGSSGGTRLGHSGAPGAPATSRRRWGAGGALHTVPGSRLTISDLPVNNNPPGCPEGPRSGRVRRKVW